MDVLKNLTSIYNLTSVYNLTSLSNTTQKHNVTIKQVAQYFHVNVSQVRNESEETKTHLFDLYEVYKTVEREQLMAYRLVAYVLGTLIIISNLTVVISSGLILRKGQQPKSTYLLLGNVSLADTIIGISIIFGASIDRNPNLSSNPLCIFQIGLLVCPAIVSIFSVGFIAVDRYIYILHGLYYQRWFNTTRVRMGIVGIWVVGIFLAFLPTLGWTNRDTAHLCSYVDIYPLPLVLLNSFLSLFPIILVATLYIMILIKALKNLKNIKTASQINDSEPKAKPQLRIYRGNQNVNKNFAHSVKYPVKTNNSNIKRSASFAANSSALHIKNANDVSAKSKSINDLNTDKNPSASKIIEMNGIRHSNESVLSLSTNESFCTNKPSDASMTELHEPNTHVDVEKSCKIRSKPKEPNKWRAIMVVFLTTGCFLFTWLPFFFVVLYYEFCNENFESRCRKYRVLIAGPLGILAFCNSLVNPLIYAWWHKRFQSMAKMYIQKYISILFACLPALGWTGKTFTNYRCWYITVFPRSLLIIMSCIILSVIITVCVLYFLILRQAVKTCNQIKEFKVTNKITFDNKAFESDKSDDCSQMKGSSTIITVSTETLHDPDVKIETHEVSNVLVKASRVSKFKHKCLKISRYYSKLKEWNSHPSKLKAVRTVLLITACFVGTWAPYYIAILVYVNCDISKNGYQCVPLEVLTLGPLYILGVCNSLCDPIIYAWRHSGFKRTIKRLYRKYVCKKNV